MDNQFIVNLIKFKYVLLKKECANLSWQNYFLFLQKILFWKAPKSLWEIIVRLNNLNINALIEYLNSQAIIETNSIESLAEWLCKD